MSGASIVELAKAKVNLTLEVLGRRADGYHELRSIVAFADFGDTLALTPGAGFALHTAGPMAGLIDGPNLIEKAVALTRALISPLSNEGAACIGRFDLEKRIPVAAGLGGGSADAAAAMRSMLRVFPAFRPEQGALTAAALQIGADVPVCLPQTTAFMAGVGEAVTPLPGAAGFSALLVNPGVKLATKDVFHALAAPPLNGDVECAQNAAQRLAKQSAVDEWRNCLLNSRNDLEAPARRLAPEIDDVLGTLRALPGCWLARLSGSGPTCFGLFDTPAQAHDAAAILRRDKPQWWQVATRLG